MAMDFIKLKAADKSMEKVAEGRTYDKMVAFLP